MTSATRVNSRRPSAPPGCERAKSLGGEAAGVEQHQRQRVAQRQRRGGARGRREAERTRLGVDRRVEMDVGRLRERAALVAGDGDQLARLARFRCGVSMTSSSVSPEFDSISTTSSRRDHAEVAVRAPRPDARRTPACRWRRASRRACAPTCPDLPMPLRPPRAPAVEQQSHGGHERVAEAADSAVIACASVASTCARQRAVARAGHRRRRRPRRRAVHRDRPPVAAPAYHREGRFVARRAPRWSLTYDRPDPDAGHDADADPRTCSPRPWCVVVVVPRRAPAADPRLPARRHRRSGRTRWRWVTDTTRRPATSASSASCS